MARRIRKGVQIVVYRRRKARTEFLVMHRVRNWTGWEIPKGGIEPGEIPKKAAVRELGEECSCGKRDIVSIEATGHVFSLRYPKAHRERTGYYGATFETFAAELAPEGRIDVRHNTEPEHDGFRWLPIEKASKLVCPNLGRVMKNVARSIATKQSGHSKNARLQR